jgi:para-aminobenzoate synthetase/4-amino-4-deoxychorismate lyase
MEIIADLETSPRGVYCGAVGYVAPPDAPAPRCEFSVGIRTVVVDIDEGVAEYGIGGGITWDSVTSTEYEEARLKAALLVERRPDFELLETLRWEPEQGFWWLEEHLDRLASSAGYFGFHFDDEEARQALAAAVLDEARPRVVRLLLARRGGVVVTVAEGELPPFDALPPSGVLRLMVSSEPVSSQNVFLFHKTSRRRTYQQQLGHFPDADDVVLVNERGHVTETTTCNVVARHGHQWWTPPLDSGLLGGVYRRVLLDKGTIAERVLTVDDLRTADEIAVVNCVRGWRPAVLAG